MYPQCTPPQVARFWEFVQRSDGCWLWTGSISYDGYPRYFYGPRPIKNAMAHRASYEWARECSLLPGFQLHHLCGVRHCVNPLHLEIVTPSEHRREHPHPKASWSHCINGHPFNAANTYIRKGREAGRRSCKACIRERKRAAGGYSARVTM